MSVKIKLKHSSVANKAPQPSDLDNGELALNTNAASPAAYIKDSNGSIVKLAGAGAIGGTDATTTAKGIVQLADATAITAGTAGLVVDAAQLKAVSDADDWTRTGTTLAPKTAGDVVNISAGTASLPGLTPVGDPDTGIYSPGADQVAIAAGGNERLRVTDGGLIGIGTSVPGALLHLSSATGSASPTPTELRIATTTNASDWSTTNPWGRISFLNGDTSGGGPKIHAAITATTVNNTGAASDLRFAANAGGSNNLFDALTIKGSSGFVGVGTQNPAQLLHVSGSSVGGSIAALVENTNSAAGSDASIDLKTFNQTWRIVSKRQDERLDFVSGSNLRASFDNAGRFLVGTTSALNASTAKLQCVTTANITTTVYADNTAAKAGGLVAGDIYRKADGTLMITF